MQLSIQRLRWVLMASAVLLSLVLVAYIGYGRYRALKAYRQILSHAGVSLTRDSNGVTYSQSIQGRKVFTVRAKTERSLGGGKWALHDAEMLIYDREGHDADHVYGSEIEYDQNEGIARADGEVYMDLQPPQGLADRGHANLPLPATASAAPVIHVHTSGLVYQRKLGMAATTQQVNFSYGDMQCTAVGAEFNSSQNTLRLLANVHMDGLAHGKPLHLAAASAEMDRTANLAHLARPTVTSDGRSAGADAATLNLRKDGSIEHLEGQGHVVLTAATRQVTANQLDAILNPQSVPQTAKLTGRVVLTDTDATRPTHGSADAVDIAFDAKGAPATVIATGGAELAMVDQRGNSQGLKRSMDGEKIVAHFFPEKLHTRSQIKEIHATGAAHASGESIVRPAKNAVVGQTKPLSVKQLKVAADDLRVIFTPTDSGASHPQSLEGTGHTQLQQDAPTGEQETSGGDTLLMTFGQPSTAAEATGEARAVMSLSTAVQAGHVTVSDRAAAKSGSTEAGTTSTGTADRASYDGSTQILTLMGDAHLWGDDASLVAPTVAIDERTQNADATGGVQATFENAPRGGTPGATAATKPDAVTHILAARAHFEHGPRLATFYGTDAQPARMWQGASQVQAATLFFDGFKRTFSARPAKAGDLIHAIFASNPATAKPGKSERAASMMRVASDGMDYNDKQREATFFGGVAIDGTMGAVRGDHAAVFLVTPSTAATAKSASLPAPTMQAQPSPFGGSIDRVVVYNNVQLDEPERHGTGDQLLYTAATGTYVLTGTPTDPPRIVDAHQGDVTGATLLFGNAGSTIVVSGDPSAPKGKGGRVRSETHVSPGKEERQ